MRSQNKKNKKYRHISKSKLFSDKRSQMSRSNVIIPREIMQAFVQSKIEIEGHKMLPELWMSNRSLCMFIPVSIKER